MRKPASNSLPAMSIRFKPEADRQVAVEVELLMSVLPQLITAMAETTERKEASQASVKFINTTGGYVN